MKQSCRLCGNNKLTQFLDLGYTPPADTFLLKAQLDEPETHYPLKVLRCDSCMFVQLSYVVPPDVLYRNDYPYESSITRTGRKHFDDFAKVIVETYGLADTDLVIDIGSNVGVLLKGFQDRGCRVLGIEPADNIAQIANKNNIQTEPVFFSTDVAKQILSDYGKTKVITASNVFAHIDDLNAVLECLDILLDDDGIFVIEAPYLANLISNLEYDTIYHEHLSYLSIKPLVPFFKNNGFEIFDIQQVDIHGGSIRIFVSRQSSRKISEKVSSIIKIENDNDIYSTINLMSFSNNVKQNRSDLMSLLYSLKSNGKRIAAVSAPAKGMTLLNYCGIGKNILEFVTEKSNLKINKYTPGGHIKVLPDSALVTEEIDYALLLAWNFKDEIMENLSEYRDAGGKFIIPIPNPTIV
jgi:SAM-dependent methyltransferase